MKARGSQAIFWAIAAIFGGGLVLPILIGLWQTILPAFGHMPAIGEAGFNLDAWRGLSNLPGIGTSLHLTLCVGLASTVLSLVFAVGFHASLVQPTTATRNLYRLIAPMLAAPHAAVAIGLAFLIAPSGWLFRILSPWATGLQLPPDLTIVHDPAGLSLIAGLVIKETPFLILVMASALNQIPHRQHLASAQALGYRQRVAWIAVVFPQIYPQIRLAIFAVLAFSLSVVDMSIILGPANPPPLAVQTLRWFSTPDVTMLLPASASSVLLALLVVASILLWWLLERVAIILGRQWIERGTRSVVIDRVLQAAGGIAGFLIIAGVLSLLTLVIWSLTWRWPFPAALPERWSVNLWLSASRDWGQALLTTVSLAASSSLASLVLAIALLEATDRTGRTRLPLPGFLIYLPLILPQASFMFGLHIAFLNAGLGGSLISVAWSHMVFVFPYVMLTLTDPWRALDPRYARTASALGRKPLAILLLIKLPILLRPLLTALAIGFAVSVAQYLPTLVIGEGRVETLTTEAVALSSGGDRRVIGVFASLQALLPLLLYGLALALPALVFARRKGLSGASA